MSIELITGRAGKPHVDSQDVRAYQAYTAGSGRYVLHGATCSVESANEVSIAPGEILVDGTHVRVMGDGESVTLANGQTGYKRADIIALHYTVTGSGESIVESMEFTVVQGSPSDTDPADPDMPQSGSILDGVTETYIPYARVVIDGLSPQDPIMLVEQYALPIEMGGTGATSAPTTLGNLGFYKKLWSGTWSSGSINVPGVSDYGVLLFTVAGYNYGHRIVMTKAHYHDETFTDFDIYYGITGSFSPKESTYANGFTFITAVVRVYDDDTLRVNSDDTSNVPARTVKLNERDNVGLKIAEIYGLVTEPTEVGA